MLASAAATGGVMTWIWTATLGVSSRAADRWWAYARAWLSTN